MLYNVKESSISRPGGGNSRVRSGPRALAAWLLSAACAACVGTASAAAYNPDVVRQVLRLTPKAWPGVQVEIPSAVYREFVRQQKLGPREHLPPVPYLIDHQEHLLTLADEHVRLDASVHLRVFDPDAAGWIRLLPRSIAFRDVRVNGRPDKLEPVDAAGRRLPVRNQSPGKGRARREGWLAWKPPGPGVFAITAHARVKPSRDGARRRLRCPRCQSVRTTLRVTSEGGWEVSSPDAAGRILPGPGGTAGSLTLRPGTVLSVTWRDPLARAEHEPLLTATCHAACDFAPDALRVNARLEVLIRRGKTDRLILDLPPGADHVSVGGADVRRVDGRGATRTLHLRGTLSGRVSLDLRFEIPRAAPTGRATLGHFGIRGAVGAGHLIVSNSTGGELLEDETERLEEEAFFGLPDELLALSKEKPALAYAIQRGRWRLTCDTVLASEVKLPPALVDAAHHVLVLRPDGNLMGRAAFDVRNSHRQFLLLRLPKRCRVLLALVDKKAVAITPAPDGSVAVPLRKSIPTVGGLVSFPVEIVYTGRSAGLGRKGRLRLVLPTVDAHVAYTTCRLYAPEGARFVDWRGNVRHVDRLITERAHDSMVVGRSHQADLPPAETPSLVLNAMGNLGDVAGNYFAAGEEAYRAKRLADAKEAFEKVIQTAPTSPAAARAQKLLGNIRLALQPAPEAGLPAKPTSRLGRARGQQITRGIQAGEEERLGEQRKMLRQGEQLARRGRSAEAAELFGGVILLGDELRRRGQSGKEQEAIVSRARAQLQEQLRRQKKLLQVEEQLVQTQRRLQQVDQTEAPDKPSGAMRYRAQPTEGDITNAAAALRRLTDGGQGAARPAPRRPTRRKPDQEIAEDVFGADEDGEKAKELRKVERSLAEQKRIVEALEWLGGAQKGEKKPKPKAAPETTIPVLGAAAGGPDAAVAATGRLAVRGRAGKDVLLQRARSRAAQPSPGQAAPQTEANQLATKQAELSQLTQQLRDLQRAKETHQRRLQQDMAKVKPRDTGAVAAEGRPGPVQNGAESLINAGDYEGALRMLDAARDTARAAKDRDVSRELDRIRRLADRAQQGRERLKADEDKRRLEQARLLAEPEGERLDDLRRIRGERPLEPARRLYRDKQYALAAKHADAVLRADPESREALAFRDRCLAAKADEERAVREMIKSVVPPATWQPFHPDDWDEKRKRTAGITLEKWEMEEAERPERRTVVRYYDVTDLTVEIRHKSRRHDLMKTVAENVKAPVGGITVLSDGRPTGTKTIAYRNGKLVVTHTPEVQEQVRELLHSFRRHWEQKVNVSSFNTFIPEDVAVRNGVVWTKGNNDVKYAVVDEGIVRTLVDLSQDNPRTLGVETNPLANDAPVGGNTFIANNDRINVDFGADTGNTLDYLDNGVFVPHGKYLLVSNGDYLTVVQASKMHHLTERIARRRVVVAAAPRLHLPLVGRVIKFEKTLLGPGEEPVLCGDYRFPERKD